MKWGFLSHHYQIHGMGFVGQVVQLRISTPSGRASTGYSEIVRAGKRKTMSGKTPIPVICLQFIVLSDILSDQNLTVDRALFTVVAYNVATRR